MPTQTLHVQQVRAEIAFSPRLLQPRLVHPSHEVAERSQIRRQRYHRFLGALDPSTSDETPQQHSIWY